MTRDEKLKILSLSPILYNYLLKTKKMNIGILTPKVLGWPDIPTSTKDNQYLQDVRKGQSQSDIRGININGVMIEKHTQNDFMDYRKFIIKDNVLNRCSETIPIHRFYNHGESAWNDIEEFNNLEDIHEVRITITSRGVGIVDDHDFHCFRKNMFEHDILWYFYIPNEKEIYFLLERNPDIFQLTKVNEKREIITENSLFITQSTAVEIPSQIIYYGVPGTGKSHLIKSKIKNELQIENQEDQVTRTVFHPEYSNADFVGQILPKTIDGKPTYDFVPGPFSKILKKALLDLEHQYVLVIEEINRGNAAAIFGELFQLLDRIESGIDEIGGNKYEKGWSDYFVMNDSINEYIRDAKTYEEKMTKSIKISEKIHFSANTGIRLPPNLSIYATMNTSDQNVFTLDNAFQRRWDMELVKNEFGDLDETKNQREAIIENLEISWEQFQNNINSIIAEKSSDLGLSSMEDKRLGCWFVKAEQKEGEYKITKEVFAQKVLKYLYDDAFKFSRAEVFNKEYKTFEQLSNAFINPKNASGFDIFTTDVKSRLNEMLKQDQSKVEQQIPDQVGNDNNISENE